MKNSIRGWKEIFCFNFIQSMKSKTMKIATIVLCMIALLSMPVISLINGSDDNGTKKESTTIKQVKVVDMTGMNLLSGIRTLTSSELYDEEQTPLYQNIEYTEAEVDMEKIASQAELKDIYTFEEDSECVYMQIMYYEDSFDIQIIHSEKTKVTSEDADDYSEFVKNHFSRVLQTAFALDEEALNILESENVVNGYDISVIGDKSGESDIDEDIKKEKEEEHARNAYNIMYALLMIVMFTLAFGGERIAMSIITEKSSKVMEYLMTSVKPMAIVVGKLLSNLLILFFQLGMTGLSFIVSLYINGLVVSEDGEMLPSYLSRLFNMNNFAGTSPFTILLAVLLIIGGFVLFGLIAALAGASVSKMEEMSEGVKMYTIILIIGAYIGLFALSSQLYADESLLKNVIMLVPFTSVFIAPGAMLTGYLSVALGCLSLVIMLVVIVLLTKFVANVYESMVYYNGAALKLKDIINISKQNNKKSGKE